MKKYILNTILATMLTIFPTAAMMTYSSSAIAKGIKESDSSIAVRVLEALNAAKVAAEENASSERLAAMVTDARQASKLVSVGELASQVQLLHLWDGLRAAKKHYKYAVKAAKCSCEYRGMTEDEHREKGAEQVVKSIAEWQAIKEAVE